VIRRLFVLGVVMALVAGAAVWKYFLFPAAVTPKHADAVVMFVGGRGERLDTSGRLVQAGIAMSLVIPNGRKVGWTQANRLCRGGQSFKVFCPTTTSDNTRGEARAIASVANEQGWQHLLLVTSTYHVTRARLLLSRCFDGNLDAARAGPGVAVARYVSRVSHEIAGVAEATLINRGC
jgi:uncharacterized SAM-binding protein YcdF (DUF218 family)